MSTDQYEPDVDYAVLLKDEHWSPGKPMRPYRARYRDGQFVIEVEDPDPELAAHPPTAGAVLGRWDDRVHPLVGPGLAHLTWRQLANHYLGQELRRDALADRLAQAGIPRFAGNRTKLVLNFDELDELLTKAGH